MQIKPKIEGPVPEKEAEEKFQKILEGLEKMSDKEKQEALERLEEQMVKAFQDNLKILSKLLEEIENLCPEEAESLKKEERFSELDNWIKDFAEKMKAS